VVETPIFSSKAPWIAKRRRSARIACRTRSILLFSSEMASRSFLNRMDGRHILKEISAIKVGQILLQSNGVMNEYESALVGQCLMISTLTPAGEERKSTVMIATETADRSLIRMDMNARRVSPNRR
jgi:hypothetical protein